MKKTIVFSVLMVVFIGFTLKNCKNNSNKNEEHSVLTSITNFYPKSHFSRVYKNWDEIGTYTKEEVVSYTNSNNETHYYQVVEIPNGGVEWLCAVYLAEQSGGYLVCPETKDENEFVFNLINNEKYWYTWDETHNYVTSGPPIGGFQKWDESKESNPSEGWMWLSGEPMSYTNWCKNLDDGTLDADPRNNNQPNDSKGGNQDAMCYGEITARVDIWGDFPIRFGDLRGGEGATFYAFVIEYEENPNKQLK